jgi:hypothetical protein
LNFFRAISNILRFDRTNWKALALCFFAAAVFWIFNALNKDYATNIRFPLEFDYDNSKFIAVEPLPSSLLLNVSGNGWEILRKSLGFKVPGISMPVERPGETHRIVGSTLSPVVASQIGTLQLNYIVTDTLRLSIEPRASRKIRLRPDVREVTFKEQYGRISPVVILPDSVTLDGPKRFIESLPDTVSIPVRASRISSNFRQSISILVSNKDIIRHNPPVAQVIFEVGPVEEIVRYARLEISRAPGGMQVDKDSVRCVFLVPQKEQARFVDESTGLSAVVLLATMKKGESKSFLPSLRNIPDYAELVLIDSVKVKKY